nr:type IV secretion protein Rhs [uncultured Kingella sp.]
MPRYLTPAETALLFPIFRRALDYAAIRIYPRRYLPLQNARTAMSPNGCSFYPAALYCRDFAQAGRALRHLFVHECVHIWQQRLGFPVRLCGICLALQGGYVRNRAYAYRHLLAVRNDLAQFNMEQQAQMIADYFCPITDGAADTDLARVLRRFLHDPADSSLLPQRICL